MKRQRERDLGVETERKKNIEVEMYREIDRGKDTKSAPLYVQPAP